MPLMPGAVPTILDAIGHTPLVKLNRLGSHTRAQIYVKCEYMNPGGSMKDRIGVQIVDDAEKRGALRPGGTIVEATSGNTGMGLALVAAVRGYSCVFVMPDKMSEEKIKALRAVGAKVVVCPTNVEPEDPRSYYAVARRIAEETPNAFLANQYHNPSNPLAHYNSTGPEIWEQTQGEFDVFVAGMGTGGTLSGAGRYFKEKKAAIKVVGVDPVGSVYYDYFKTGKLLTLSKSTYKVEGIGEDFLPSTMNFQYLDDIMRVSDKECFMAARDLVRQEGILCGGSGGAAVAGAVKYAEMAASPERVIVHLPDTAYRYLTKYLDDEWMRENGFLGPSPTLGKVRDLLKRGGEIHSAQSQDSVRSIIERMKRHGISQIPVYDGHKLTGIVQEKDLLTFLVQGEVSLDSEIGPLVETNVTAVDLETPVASLAEMFNRVPIVLVLSQGDLKGVVTKIDLIEYMAARVK